MKIEAMISQVLQHLQKENPGVMIIFIPFSQESRKGEQVYDIPVYQIWPDQEIQFVGFGEN